MKNIQIHSDSKTNNLNIKNHLNVNTSPIYSRLQACLKLFKGMLERDLVNMEDDREQESFCIWKIGSETDHCKLAGFPSAESMIGSFLI